MSNSYFAGINHSKPNIKPPALWSGWTPNSWKYNRPGYPVQAVDDLSFWGTSIKPTSMSYTYSYTNSTQTITLQPGIYTIECWGANGGNSYVSGNTVAVGGKGGYAKGTLTLTKDTTLYITVGGKGGTATATTGGTGGYNGGGSVANHANRNSGGGGGASDVRILSNNLYNRVIVAGGGGGAGATNSYSSYTDYQGKGHGGGNNGLAGNYTTQITANGQGGTQTIGGANATYSETQTTANGTSSFGSGASGGVSSSFSTAAGGGGWYGGGAALYTGWGGGGSGYVLTSNSSKPTGYFSSYSQYYLTDTVLATADDSTFVTNPDTAGNGYIKIVGTTASSERDNTNQLNPYTVSWTSTTSSNEEAIDAHFYVYSVPASGWYIISAGGGWGSVGSYKSASYSPPTMNGPATVTTRVWLNKNDQLRICVGRSGKNIRDTSTTVTDGVSGGGGGSSSVWRVINEITDDRYQFTKAGKCFVGEKWECLVLAAGGAGTRDGIYSNDATKWAQMPTCSVTPCTPSNYLGRNSGNSISTGTTNGPLSIINQDGIGGIYTRGTEICYGGYGGGNANDDQVSPGNGWYNAGTAPTQTVYSWALGDVLNCTRNTSTSSVKSTQGFVQIYEVTQ